MKRALALILALLLIGSAALASTAFTSMREIQHYLDTHCNANDGPYKPSVEITGIILDLHQVTGNHYDMILAIDEDNVWKPIGFEQPILTADFRLHVDPIPFEVGQEVTVAGELNLMYSSIMNPYVVVNTINGTTDY